MNILNEAQKIGLVLLLSFLVGLEREERKVAEGARFSFGGVRTFPLLGILGYTLALISPNQPLTIGFGLLAVGGFMLLSFMHKLSESKSAGITSEISGLITYLLGAVVYYEHYWIATTLVVAGVLLLELKLALEGLAQKISAEEILTFTKFLLLSAVILPILPDSPLTPYQINPFKTWLIVVAISALSYGSYILQRLIGDKGAVLSAVLGGAYSSTAVTIALSKRSVDQNRPGLFSGAVLIACGVMYLRLAVLISFFSASLRERLALPFCVIGAVAIALGYLWTFRGDKHKRHGDDGYKAKNPLELTSALVFGFLFVGMLVITRLALLHLGTGGIYGLATVTGVTDVDPFILGLTQSAAKTTPLEVAAAGVVIAAASNNVAKGVYAFVLSDRKTGRQSFFLLLGLAAVGLLPLIL